MLVIRKLLNKTRRTVSYEFWPYWMFYAALAPYAMLLAFRARSLTYFTAANPRMINAGVIGTSKFDAIKEISPKYLPKTILLNRGIELPEALVHIHSVGIDFPFIIKPNVGERGQGVEVVYTELDLQRYLLHNKHRNLIAQEFVSDGIELGIMYYKLPGSNHGAINSIVAKDYLSIVGDGESTIETLISEHLRSGDNKTYLLAKFKDRLQEVLEDGNTLILEPIGNHSRGTTFLNANHLNNLQLVHVFDDIAGSIDEFYYGRFDIKVPSIEDLYAGKNISIMELNGVSAEPAHIYDPEYRLVDAYKDLKEHFDIVFNISMLNRDRGVEFKPLPDFLEELKHHYAGTDPGIIPAEGLNMPTALKQS